MPTTTFPPAAFLGDRSQCERVFAQGRWEKVAALTRLYPHFLDTAGIEAHLSELGDLEVIFSTWGMPLLTPAQLDRLPALRAVFYAAGTVQGFARPLLERGILVVSSWMANAVPVAEFTLAQILLAMKGYFTNVRESHQEAEPATKLRRPGNFGETIALLGAGAIGRKLIELLRSFELQVLVFDPFLSEERAATLGVEKVTLEAAFARGYVVSNHLANLPETRRLLAGKLFASMREGATFINTGRGATVDEPAMLQILQERPDLEALLDVTWPEPPAPDSLVHRLPNVHYSTHIAGSLGDEVVRMADYAIEEFLAWRNGQPLRYAISLEMLNTSA